MSDAAIRAALEAAAMRVCICDGECFETRHGMMHGPCDRQTGRAAAAITAFLRALPERFPLRRAGGQTWGHAHGEMRRIAAAVEEAARDG